MGATDSLKTAVERAKVLMTMEQHSDATAAVKTQHSGEFHQLQQLTTLTEQVAVLSVAQPSASPGKDVFFVQQSWSPSIQLSESMSSI